MARASQICARVMESSSRLRTARRVRGRRTSSAPRRKRTELADRAAEKDKTMTGTIAKVMSDKGFGFIQGEDGQEYFMHRSAVRDGSVFEQLREGQTVVFDAGRGGGGSTIFRRIRDTGRGHSKNGTIAQAPEPSAVEGGGQYPWLR